MVDYRDRELRARMDLGYDVRTGMSDPPRDNRRVLFWVNEKRNFPLIDAVLYSREGGMPEDVVFLQCSIQSPPEHAKQSPSRAVLHGKHLSALLVPALFCDRVPHIVYLCSSE